MGHFARRMESARLLGDGRELSCRLFAAAPALPAGRDTQRDRMSEARPQRLPGDRQPADVIARMLRVDHAGEYGATRIYEGQLDVLGRGPVAGVVRQMAEVEKRHLTRFE